MSPLLAVWSSRDLEAAWSLLLEVCGLRWAAALLELETRRQHSWRHLGPAGWGTVAGLLPCLGSLTSGLCSLLCSKEAWQRAPGKERSEPSSLGEEGSLPPLKSSVLEQPLPIGDRGLVAME